MTPDVQLEKQQATLDDELEYDDIENEDELDKIGRPVVTDDAISFTQPLCMRDLPALPKTYEIPAPNETTESFCKRLGLRLIKGEGFGFSVQDPIGYQAVAGVTRADEYFRSIVPNVGENWKLMAFYRIGSFDKCVDKYVVMYSCEMDDETVGYAYELYLKDLFLIRMRIRGRIKHFIIKSTIYMVKQLTKCVKRNKNLK